LLVQVFFQPSKEILNLILLTMKNKYEGSNIGLDMANVATKSATDKKVIVVSKLISKFADLVLI
jgi:hypothetical protein